MFLNSFDIVHKLDSNNSSTIKANINSKTIEIAPL